MAFNMPSWVPAGKALLKARSAFPSASRLCALCLLQTPVAPTCSPRWQPSAAPAIVFSSRPCAGALPYAPCSWARARPPNTGTAQTAAALLLLLLLLLLLPPPAWLPRGQLQQHS